MNSKFYLFFLFALQRSCSNGYVNVKGFMVTTESSYFEHGLWKSYSVVNWTFINYLELSVVEFMF